MASSVQSVELDLVDRYSVSASSLSKEDLLTLLRKFSEGSAPWSVNEDIVEEVTRTRTKEPGDVTLNAGGIYCSSCGITLPDHVRWNALHYTDCAWRAVQSIDFDK